MTIRHATSCSPKQPDTVLLARLATGVHLSSRVCTTMSTAGRRVQERAVRDNVSLRLAAFATATRR